MSELESSITAHSPEKEIHRLKDELIQIACKIVLSARIISRLVLCPGDDVLAAVIISQGAADQPATIPAEVKLQREYEIKLSPPDKH